MVPVKMKKQLFRCVTNMAIFYGIWFYGRTLAIYLGEIMERTGKNISNYNKISTLSITAVRSR